MKFGKFEREAITHEIGHFIVACILGYGRMVDSIEFDIDIFNGDRIYNRLIPTSPQPTNEEQIQILYGGIVACILTNQRGKRLSGTDKIRVFALTTAAERKEYKQRTIDLLSPYVPLLEQFVSEASPELAKVMEEAGNAHDCYYRIFNDTLKQWEQRIKDYPK